MKLLLTDFSLRRPWLVILIVLLLSGFLAAQFPKVRFDNDPENMLARDEHVRLFHHRVKEKFSLYDFVIVGIVNDTHADGVFNPGTLGRIDDLTGQLLRLHRSENGQPAVVRPARADRPEETWVIDLTQDSRWQRMLNVAFQHDPNRLFDADGQSAVIAREIISPSVVDSIRQAELGSLRIQYLMEAPPTTREEALEIRDDAMSNPLYRGTLVSEDEKAICVYIPLIDKTYSHNVAALVHALTADWPAEDRVLITGLPVAEDTFGVEMLVQMATSAPMAALAIFVLMLLFFRRISLVVAPMIVAIVSVICTMGLLIGLGFDVHIMSSMIAIFLMPIAVADSIHILSEFFDAYHRFGDKARTIRHVVGHLFTPMLYTSLTTIAGFASLGLTPIPPVRIFGLHVAFGVALAWVLTMTLIPAYIMVAVTEKTLRGAAGHTAKDSAVTRPAGGLSRSLESLGVFTYRQWHLIIALTILIMGVSVYGISRIRVNDNPVKWFTPGHPIRVADEVLNEHFGGTYTAYLTFDAAKPEGHTCQDKATTIVAEAERRFSALLPDATKRFTSQVASLGQLYRNVDSSDVKKCFVTLVEHAEAIDQDASATWRAMADTINYMDPEGLTYDTMLAALDGVEGIAPADKRVLVTRLQGARSLTGEALMDRALAVCDEFTSLSFRDFVFEMEAELTAPLFKQPEMLRYVKDLQAHLVTHPVVGKTSSAVDALMKAGYELRFVAPPADATPRELADYETRNEANFSVPDTASAVGQVFTQLEGMKKKDSLFHLVTKDYAEANIWVQLKSGDNRDMEAVVSAVRAYMKDTPPPVDLNVGWAGLTYLNVVWQDKMVRGMLSSLASSFVVVLVMMMVLFRSPLYGVLSMIPLTVTISLIYGLIGIVGKDYDMPVAVLSALTLGLSVDFAIHFLQRARELRNETGSWEKTSRLMFKEPAMAISRNAITISVGFTPLLLAPLVPYKTVGFFLACIMAVSWAATLLILPALITPLQRFLFRDAKTPEGDG